MKNWELRLHHIAKSCEYRVIDNDMAAAALAEIERLRKMVAGDGKLFGPCRRCGSVQAKHICDQCFEQAPWEEAK